VGGESRARAHLCNDSLQQLSRVSIYATCGHGVQLPHKLPAAITSFHQHSQAHSQQQQAPAAGGQGWGPPCRGLRREALARSRQIRRQIRRAWALLHVHSAGLLGQRRLLAVPDFFQEFSHFSFPGIRERKMIGIPRRLGNGSPGIHTLLLSLIVMFQLLLYYADMTEGILPQLLSSSSFV